MPSPAAPPIRRQYLDEQGKLAGDLPALAPQRLKELYVHMLRVRCMDERMLKLQRAGRVGFVGSMKGQEAAMIGTAAALEPRDWLWSGLREGGAALMRGLPLSEYIAQMYCNSNDTAKGRQMCNHLQHKGSNYPSWSSVIGTQIPHGVGAAFAAKQRGLDEVHAIYFGDGASSSNGFHSGMNLAAVWKAPCVFVLTDNGWAISVPSCGQSAAPMIDKGVAYGMPAHEVDGNDVLACYAAMQRLVADARAGKGPALLVVKTYRIAGHSSSDDPTKYRDAAEVEQWEKRDPLQRYERFLVARKLLAKDEARALEQQLLAEIDAAIHVQEAAPPMALKTLVEDVYADVPRHLRVQYNDFVAIAERLGHAQKGDGAFPL
ncbi:MAG: thiamine pyrophosphate-dependent dehydrogenase E1 component subunit alpha [Planctomycetota bacterium]|nr:MAG: thiamine pyrophosphate-dependent dehydrogenase E1 component subunit alpha [Planctomycetota bacterium]